MKQKKTIQMFYEPVSKNVSRDYLVSADWYLCLDCYRKRKMEYADSRVVLIIDDSSKIRAELKFLCNIDNSIFIIQWTFEWFSAKKRTKKCKEILKETNMETEALLQINQDDMMFSTRYAPKYNLRIRHSYWYIFSEEFGYTFPGIFQFN